MEEGVVAETEAVDVDAASVTELSICLRARKDNRVGDLPHHQMQVDAEVDVEDVVEGVDVDAGVLNHLRQTRRENVLLSC